MKSITNNVFLRGKVSSEFQFSHNENKDCYYMSEIEIKRTSGYTDRIPVMVSNKTYILPKVGSHVCVKGHFHSYKQNITGRNRLMLKVLALEIMYWNKKAEETDENRIYLDGFICKQPVCRKTPMGRYIADVCVAVNLSHNHSDYLPCIFWGKNARDVSHLPVGCSIQLWGRIQSRKYFKETKEKREERIAYEVSVSEMKYTAFKDSNTKKTT